MKKIIAIIALVALFLALTLACYSQKSNWDSIACVSAHETDVILYKKIADLEERIHELEGVVWVDKANKELEEMKELTALSYRFYWQYRKRKIFNLILR